MTAEITETSTQPQQKRTGGHHGKAFMSPARKRQLITEIAIGDIPQRQLAHKYSITHQYVRLLAVEHKEEITEIRAEIVDKERQILWPTDRFARNYERITDLVQISEEMERHRAAASRFADSMDLDGEPTSEHWLRLVAQKQAILKAIAEDYGQLPTRAPAAQPVGDRASIELVGIDTADLVKHWESAG